MKKFTVTGMSCAACSARVEKAVKAVDGVDTCSVSLLTNSMGVEGNFDENAVISAVVDAGYGASVQGAGAKQAAPQMDSLKDTTTPKLKKRLFSSLFFLIVLMYFSMGHMLHLPLPQVIEENPLLQGLIQLLLTTIVMVINQAFFISGFKGLIHRAPNMDTLVSLGSAASYLYSVWSLFAMAYHHADPAAMGHYLHEFYFESAAMILTLITVGKMLEARSKGKTTNALKSLMNLSPKTAVVLRNDKEVTVGIEEVQKGDFFVVRPGESIPVDGVITKGQTAVNEAALTGESVPVDKQEGDHVSAATLNQSGYIVCQATRVGEDTTLSQIIKMVSDAAATKAPIAKVADKVSGIFVPTVISIALVTLVIWLLVGQTFGFALARGISVLVISCPCALGLATPVAIMVGNGLGARHGILFKTAAALEETGRATIVALDKTGTLTTGHPTVTDMAPAKSVSEKELLTLAASLEKKSEHPLAVAVMEYAEKQNLTVSAAEDFEALPGNGLKGTLNGKTLVGGNMAFISSRISLPDDARKTAEDLANQGKTPLFFAEDDRYLGMIAVADTLKEDSTKAVSQLRNMGIRTVMLTGDNARTAKAIGKLAGVDEVISDVKPDGKANVIQSLKKQGKVIMVGDGINDAPALTSADMGMAIGAGTDVAVDAADVVLMNNNLLDVGAAIRLSRATLRNIHENLFWAFFYNAIGIPLAAGAFIALLGWEMNPMIGAAAMSMSSFCVVSNALRLNLFDMYSTKRDHKHKNQNQSAEPVVTSGSIDENDSKYMKKVMKIEGMMCGHCEARVKKVLEDLDGVAQATPSHTAGTCVVLMTKDVDNAQMKKVVEDQGYKVHKIQ